jgi:hypothetical protein
MCLCAALSACAGGAAADADADVFTGGEADAAVFEGDAGPRPDALRPGSSDAGGAGGEPADTDALAPVGGGAAPPSERLDAAVERPPEVCLRMRVVNTLAEGLNVRPDPSTAQPAITVWFDGTEAEVLAEVQGQDVDGNTLWYEVQREGVHGFVSTIWAECIARGAPPAPPPAPGARDDVFLLPFDCGQTRVVTQGNASGRGHDAAAAYAFDFDLPLGAPLRAMKPGDVLYTRDATREGDPCWSGGGQACVDAANSVVLGHADGSRTRYAHLGRVLVTVGQHVAQGDAVGEVGGTGWSAGPHAHVARTEACNVANCNSISLVFADVGDDGVPAEGERVTSENGCPVSR